MTSKKRAYLRGENAADFSCPHCGRRTTVRLDHPVRSSTPVRVRVSCPCGRRHTVFLERRASGRKDVNIQGRMSVNGDGEHLPMMVHNLSRTGILFQTDQLPPSVGVGDVVVVEFELRGARLHRVVKEALVRRVDDGFVGAEYRLSSGCADDREYDLALAFHPGRGDGTQDFARR